MSFLNIENKKILIFGIANKKSVAFHIAKILLDEGAKVIASVQSEQHAENLKRILPDIPYFICDFRNEKQMEEIAELIGKNYKPIDGIVHSVAFANFANGLKPFHATSKKDFLEAVEISCWSFIKIADLYKDFMAPCSSMLTISISTTKMAAENYGFMAPIKAALDSSVCFLAKSLSDPYKIRVNAIGAGLLKTSSSAGIPGYIEPYLFAEKVTLRKENLHTEEVASVAAFLLSEKASGINAQTVIVDAGMSVNYFDKAIVKKVLS
ncbi:MAG TPA: SDR family oxidoreductase [Victivallales bacterium]|nr:SDR family oxidoreductase [Victivallales bacterium]HPO90553.1 SDR family oxidoreductase [Victivallales bacterium]HRR05941.1 SDR family oxidoreductase [Victivallales bacterium]HRR28538.1 SDR family oxidoreductase [Victivallales bacterium]HRU02151.1 SDR family oxidoreductase [Victivallales bacterium]